MACTTPTGGPLQHEADVSTDMLHSERIPQRQGIHHAEADRQQKDFSPPPEVPLSKAALRKRPREDSDSQTSPEPSPKAAPVSFAEIRKNFDRGQVRTTRYAQSDRLWFWNEQGTWPSEAEERDMATFRANHLAGVYVERRSSPFGLKRSRSGFEGTASLLDYKSLSKTTSDTSTYRNDQVTKALEKFGSFMQDHEEGFTPESKALCQELTTAPHELPEDTLFSDKFATGLFQMVKGKNEATIVRYILPELVPSPVERALRGAKGQRILTETINASWVHATPCCGYRPHPDYSIGIHRNAFSPEQLQKLQPLIGTRVDQESRYTATYDTCFPFLTTEVKSGASSLDIADRQNALCQTVALRGLVTLFRLVNREQELHRKVLGFSISHDNDRVRIYAHYPFIDGVKTTYHQALLSSYSITPPVLDRGTRWETTRFVLNVEDSFAPQHYKLVCSAVDMLPDEDDHAQRSALLSQME